MAILPHYLSILPNLLISELHGTLSRHVFEETAERGLVFKSQQAAISLELLLLYSNNRLVTFAAVQQQAFRFRFHPFMNHTEWEGSLHVEKIFDRVLGDLCNISA